MMDKIFLKKHKDINLNKYRYINNSTKYNTIFFYRKKKYWNIQQESKLQYFNYV